MTGKVILDEYGDREPDYWITDMAPNGTFIKVAEILNLDLGQRVSWSYHETLSLGTNGYRKLNWLAGYVCILHRSFHFF